MSLRTECRLVMSVTIYVLLEAWTAYPSRAPEFIPVVRRVRVAHLFRFLCYDFCVICLRPLSCVPNVACVSRLSILDYPFAFL